MFSFSAPDDYSATSVELTFSRIQRRACVLIALVNDEFYDNEFGSMSFFVTLESNDSAVLLRRTQASVIIRENDGKELLFGFNIAILLLLLYVFQLQ